SSPPSRSKTWRDGSRASASSPARNRAESGHSTDFRLQTPAFVVKMHFGASSGEEHHRLQPRAKGAESLPKAHHLPAGTQQVLSRSDGGLGAAPAGRAESALLLQALQGLWLRLAALPGSRRYHPDPGPSRSQGAEADAGEGQSPDRSHASSG